MRNYAGEAELHPDVKRMLELSYADAETRGMPIEEGLVRLDKPGHTRQVAQLACCHEGRYTANAYAVGTLLGRIDEKQGLAMLSALAALQIADAGSEHYGGFRWYREESCVQDTNAAFFILMPLVTVRLTFPGALPSAHLEAIDRMLRLAAHWFGRECQEPQLYYPNKIMSDGALLLAIAGLLGDRLQLEKGIEFYGRWDEYTERRGWGWGENLSLVYQAVMLNALKAAVLVLEGTDGGSDDRLAARARLLAERLRRRMDELLAIVSFHDGEEFVPTIRSYNFDGRTRRDSLLWVLAGAMPLAAVRDRAFDLNQAAALLLFGGELAACRDARPPLPAPRVREDRIFDRSKSYTWIGQGVRLGTLNRFPVMPGSYQWPTWGLGWQSFPVSFSVRQEQVTFLRWRVDDGTHVRVHPAEGYSSAYLMPALFREEEMPDVRTACVQREGTAIVLRGMGGVRNKAAAIADEWVAHRYKGDIERIRTDDREWYVFRYAEASVAVTPLLGIAAGCRERGPLPVRVLREEGRVLLRQTLYDGEAQRLDHPLLETGWAVVCVDRAADRASLSGLLADVRIADRVVHDHEVPREPYTLIRDIEVQVPGSPPISLRVDPLADGRG